MSSRRLDPEWTAEHTSTHTIYRRKPLATTWWSKRWVEALETMGRTYASRLPRGRTYARLGRVTGLRVAPGVATAYVEGSRPTPYRTEIRIRAWTAEEWSRAVAALAGRARYAARLLAGEMPDDVEDVLAHAGLGLFPAGDLSSRCSCPDSANPCKHVAAVHYVLARALDDDPFWLFALRGRDRDSLLASLAAARGGAPAAGVHVADLDPATYERPGEPLPKLTFTLGDPARAGALVASLGPLAGDDPEGLFGDDLRRMAAAALDLL